MDELSNRVRELAPTGELGASAIASARADLHAAIAAAPARTVRAKTFRLPRMRLSLGVIAAAVAIVVVAVIAIGAFVSTQLLSRPDIADPPAELDLSQPLWDQLGDRVLRVATTTVEPYRDAVDGFATSDDTYLMVRTVRADYVTMTGPWISVVEDEPSEILSEHGRDGQALAQQYASQSNTFRYEQEGLTQAQLAGAPTDIDGFYASLGERYQNAAPTTQTEREAMFWFYVAPDPLWYFLTVEQRTALVDGVVGGDTTRTEIDGNIVLQLGEPALATLSLDSTLLVPVAGTSPVSLVEGLEYPDVSWTRTVELVDAMPPEPEPDDTAQSSCGEVPIPDWIFNETDLEGTLDDNGRAAIAGEGVPELDPAEWLAVYQGVDEVILWSWVLHAEYLMDESWPEGIDGPTHELLTITMDDAGTWSLKEQRPCVMEQIIPGYETVDVELDPAFPLSADDTQLHLLVTPRSCGATATDADRVELVELNEVDEVIELLVGLRLQEGSPGTCEGNEAIAFTVDLEQPLGDRPVFDLTYMEARPLRR